MTDVAAPKTIAQSLSEMIVEWVDGGIKMGADWRGGLSSVIALRLKRLGVVTGGGEFRREDQPMPTDEWTSVHVLTLFCEHWRGRHEWGSYQFMAPDLDRCIGLAEKGGWTVSRERRMATCPACTGRLAEVEGRAIA